MLFTLLKAIGQKHWTAATANAAPVPHTITPIADLTQRSAVDFGAAPIGLILAQGNGSLIQTPTERSSISAIGTLKYLGHTFYRVYLSTGDGAFLHIAVSDAKPNEVLEFRLYQPYTEFVPTHKTVADLQAAGLDDANYAWETWMLENADPAVGGLIGCPTLISKPEDIDPATQTQYAYNRTWTPGNTRILPVSTVENLLDGDGNATRISHDLMSYARPLKDGKTFEYLLVSAASGPDGASVAYWLGVDMKTTDVTVYAPAAG